MPTLPIWRLKCVTDIWISKEAVFSKRRLVALGAGVELI
jgi:hypothetical protein